MSNGDQGDGRKGVEDATATAAKRPKGRRRGLVGIEKLLDEERRSRDLLAAEVERLVARCQERGVRLERNNGAQCVYLPAGTDLIECPVDDDEPVLVAELADAIGTDLVVLGDYAALARLDAGYIEAFVGPIAPDGRPYRVDSQVFPPDDRPDVRLRRIGSGCVTAGDPDAAYQLELSTASALFMSLRTRFVNVLGDITGYDVYTTLKISGIPLRDARHAQTVLETLAQSFAFDLDVRYRHGFRLMRRPVWPPVFSRTSADRDTPPARQPLPVPVNRYASEALRYYWYARAASGAPLLQYLAYYQVLEYFFPRCVNQEAVDRLRLRLRDPRADIGDDAWLSGVLSMVLSISRARNSEREQLKITMRRCLLDEQLRDFIAADPELRRHLARKDVLPGMPSVKLDGPDGPTGLVDRVGDRIYDLRCRVVHAKADGDDGQVQLILPDTDEAATVAHDVKIVRFVAQAVLIGGATSLRREDL